MANKYINPGTRIMDTAFLRDGEIEHRGEALLLALIMHTKGKTKRAQKELEQVGKLFDDPNLTKPKNARR